MSGTYPSTSDASDDPRPWRVALAGAGALLLLGVAAATFWWQDWRYSLPAPRPAGLVQAAPGTVLAAEGGALALDGRPLFLHFASADCPCSRFVREHVRALAEEHGARAAFAAVVREPGDAAGLGLREIADPRGELAERLGVYATPQAVILGADGALWYRGNYNASRWCVQPESAFARIALEALLAGAPRPALPAAAEVAYGCALPLPGEEAAP